MFSLPIAPLYPAKLWARSRSADIVILHAPFPLADLVYGVGLNRRVKLIVYWHSDIIRQKVWARLLRPLFKRTLERAAAIIVSDDKLVEATSVLSRYASKCLTAPFPVDEGRFKLSHSEDLFVKELEQRFPRLVVACGRLVGYKGFDVLVSAAGVLKDAQIVVIGEGPERARLQAQIDANGLSERVHLLGAKPERDVVCYLRAAKIFAMPSVSVAETFGIAQLEAMAAGCPIVNTSIPTAVPMVARDGREALTVRPGDSQALALALERLLDDETLRLSFGAAARARARESFSRERYEETISNLLESLVEDHAIYR